MVAGSNVEPAADVRRAAREQEVDDRRWQHRALIATQGRHGKRMQKQIVLRRRREGAMGQKQIHAAGQFRIVVKDNDFSGRSPR